MAARESDAGGGKSQSGARREHSAALKREGARRALSLTIEEEEADEVKVLEVEEDGDTATVVDRCNAVWMAHQQSSLSLRNDDDARLHEETRDRGGGSGGGDVLPAVMEQPRCEHDDLL